MVFSKMRSRPVRNFTVNRFLCSLEKPIRTLVIHRSAQVVWSHSDHRFVTKEGC